MLCASNDKLTFSEIIEREVESVMPDPPGLSSSNHRVQPKRNGGNAGQAHNPQKKHQTRMIQLI